MGLKEPWDEGTFIWSRNPASWEQNIALCTVASFLPSPEVDQVTQINGLFGLWERKLPFVGYFLF